MKVQKRERIHSFSFDGCGLSAQVGERTVRTVEDLVAFCVFAYFPRDSSFFN